MNYAKDITSDYTSSYAKYVATSRAIPSLVDGLKPVSRRCINSAYDLKLFHDKKFLKVAKLEGQVMGDYHPHGGASMTILAQPFKTRYPLFEGQGNFGSPDEPNSVAASRYIETRLTKFCEDFYLTSAEYADKQDNYDGRLKEIVRYYPPIPGVLLTGSSGIAVGLSTNIPPHRISDVCKSLLDYIDGKKEYLTDLMPETCEESIILSSKEDIKKLYQTGEGSIQYKAKTHYESIEGKLALVVDAFPPDYSKTRLQTSYIMDAVESGVLELRNESSTGIRYVFLSNDKDVLAAVEERLVSSSGYKMYIEHNDKIHLYKLSELYSDFLGAREVYIQRKYRDLITKNNFECEYIRVLLTLKDDKEYLKSMFDKSPKEVSKEIEEKYNTVSEISSRIISSSLSSLMSDNAERLKKKWEELNSQIVEYGLYVVDPIVKIKKDIEELYDQYKNEERRALHIDDISDKITLRIDDQEMEASATSSFFTFSEFPNGGISLVTATDLASNDKIKCLHPVPTTFEYYVMYDEQGLVALTHETMMKLENKFKSDKLVGVIGTNDLSNVCMKRSTSNRITKLSLDYVRSRQSYIRQVDGDASIEVWVNLES